MAWYDYIPSPAFQIGNAAQGGNPFGVYDDIKEWAGKKNAPGIGENPYQQNWTNLIGQLEQQASGNGPSLAGNAFKQANQTGMNNVRSMSRGGSAGAVRGGQMQMGRLNQGLAQGYSNARLQEQLVARQMLSGALQGGGNAWFQPQQANLQAQMATPSNLQMLMSFLEQGGSIGGKIAGGM
jgi:hypothetical protein